MFCTDNIHHPAVCTIQFAPQRVYVSGSYVIAEQLLLLQAIATAGSCAVPCSSTGDAFYRITRSPSLSLSVRPAFGRRPRQKAIPGT